MAVSGGQTITFWCRISIRALLMGGQAYVFYGAAEFSRDTDLAIVADAANLSRLRQALADLEAQVDLPRFGGH